MKNNFKITLIPYDEMELIIPLVIQLNKGKFSGEILKSRLKSILEMGTYQCIGVYDAGKLIACCGFWVLNKLYAGKHVEPDNVFVEEAYRSAGIGELMMNWLFDYAKSIDCIGAEVNCYQHNEKGKKFWERKGFEPLGYHMIKKFEE
ncbi:GNAT family N-acetyltransferase [Cellulophaga baltica]|uniref:GNAT family N-acetyltransferase n=1 Tax=Cellulophaga TaxID=104264 RepID=UPI001C068851|nr:MULTISPECIES: GNAT family N-acetyltransferase [Cellulophaga]MBU2996205.1 GNAT family N-acetyltransferase [Cellulophaga baltica]MDO6767600.1 GNAT family N-acetyltransferase [Cellulophaga sp. 1_MG-2023]